MKRFFSCLILCGLVVLVGCSGDSSNQSSVSPTAAGDVWQITALEASDDNPLVNTAVAITATVTLNGDAAPDGSQVEFTANGGVFSNGETLASVISAGGEASIGFAADTAGTYTVQARVRTVTRQIQITYRDPDTSGGLQMYSINPRSGSYYGGETVVMTGKGIRNPVEVFFTVQGTQYQAIVDDVVPSEPATATGTITARTPEPTAADTTITSSADVRVVVGVGTPDEESQSYPSVFTFIGNVEPPDDVPPTPVVFGCTPFYGRSAGGETVTILGMDFTWENPDGETEPTFFSNQVYFRFRGQDILTQVERWGSGQIEVVTPRFSLTPLTADENAGVVLIPTNGENPVVKNDVFIVKTDVAQPEITGLSPTAGPLDGGTVVTITGHGFELPVQVHFGNLEATDIQLYDDQSIADNDVITCRTPDYSQQGEIPPVTVEVRVTNLQNGNTATAAQSFRYGDVLYVGQANPTEGQIGDLFALYGAGFEDPLTVWFNAGGEDEFDVIQVTGTELTLRSPPDLPPTCNDRSGSFRVVLNQSNQEATGGSYTLLGSNPTITSVDPIFVQSVNNGNGVDPVEIDIYGVRFAENLLVVINSYTISTGSVTVESSEHIHVDQIPAPNEFGLVFNTTACTLPNGLTGIREVPTPVNVTVRNLPLGCENTLTQTLVYEPEDDTCVAAPGLTVATLAFPPTQFPGPSPPQTIMIDNNGGGDLLVSGVFLGGAFYFDAGCSTQAAPGFTVPAFTNAFMGPEVYFCPTADDGGIYSGQLRIVSNDANSPYTQPLSGSEAFPTLGVTTNSITFTNVYPDTQSFDVTNTGTGDLTYSAVVDSGPFTIDSGGSGTVTPAGSATITVTASGEGTGSITVTANEPDAQGSPQVVTLTAPAP